MTHQPYDVGLQPERTRVAWRRTALSIAAVSALGMRVFPEVSGHTAWVLVGGLGLAVAGWVWWVAHARYRTFMATVTRGGEPESAGGAALGAIGLVPVVLGLCALLVFGVRWLS